MFKHLGKTMMTALAGASISMGSAMAQTTPDHVYQVVDNVKAELAEMHKANSTKPPKVKVNLTKRMPRHVLQKTREVYGDVQKLRKLKGLDEKALPSFPVRTVKPADVRGLADKTLADVKEVRKKVGAAAPTAAPLPSGKEPTDVYAELMQVKASIGGLGVPETTPNDAYQVALTIISDIEKVRAAKGIKVAVADPAAAKGKKPKDVYKEAYKLLGKVKALTKKDGYGVPGGVVMPNKLDGPITPTEVIDILNNILAEVGAIKVAVGATAATEFPGKQSGKTPSDVYNALRKAEALVDSL
ncbi:hypothetical protein [Candidatus Thiosymbion oneisti]|uniref:hypothetical protein n=1 Tax=Candidatus Thiosymbion oneisti TaxID=589554 RepID=UPI000B7D99EB|nr:hypothetical protein [Candidatus Thiosymbion oneisti]